MKMKQIFWVCALLGIFLKGDLHASFSTISFSHPKHTITIISSASCPACKKFYEKKFPKIEEYAQEKGYILEFLPYANDEKTIIVTVLTYAFGKERQHEIYMEFLNTYEEWHVRGQPGLDKIKEIALDLDIDEGMIKDAMEHRDAMEGKIMDRIQDLTARHKLDFVPCIMIDGKILVDADFEAMKKGIAECEGQQKDVKAALDAFKIA